MEIDYSNLFKLIRSYLPVIIWEIKKGHGSFVTYEMGNKIEMKNKDSTKTKGSIHLWLYLCDWSIYKNNVLLLDSNQIDSEQYDLIFKQVNNNQLIDINESKEYKKFEFNIENGYKIITSYNKEYDDDDDYFNLYILGLKTISYSKLNGLYCEE